MKPVPARLTTAVPLPPGDAPSHRLERLFQPRSVCIVGASARPGTPGNSVLRNLRSGGFAGEVSLVNRRHDEILGQASHRRIGELARPAELAVLAIPAAAAASSLRELAALGTRHAIMLGAIDLPPAARQALQRVREETGIRLLGPRTLGLVRPAALLNLTVARPVASPGTLAIVSQSSAVCAALLDFAEGSGVGLSLAVSTGAGLDIDVSDVLDYLSYDYATRSIVVYLDGVRDARRLLSTLRAVARSKPVIVLKSGRNDIGNRSHVTHTDALASDHQTFSSALRRCGAVSVDSFGELFSAVEWLDHGRRVKGDRLGIVTNGGGMGALAADACRGYSVSLATLGEATIAKLAAILPAAWSGGNPVNVTSEASPERIAAVVEAVADDPQADAVLALFHATEAADSASIAQALLAQPARSPTMYAFIGAADARHGWAVLNQHGHSVFKTPEDAVRAFSILVEYHRSQRNLLQVPSTRRASQRFDETAVQAVIDAALASAGAAPDAIPVAATGDASVPPGLKVLDEVRSKLLLAACGIPVPTTLVARTIEEAARIADRIGYPVVMKVISPDVTHKSDVGGVRLDIRDKVELRGAATGIQERLRTSLPAARFGGFALQPMVRRGDAFELLVGVSRDPAFGPVITFGAGGVTVEITADTATALPPLNSMLAHDLISRTKVSRLLSGYRHLPPADLDAIADVLVSVSALVCRFPVIQGLDINPLLAGADGVMALDARIVLDPSSPRRDSRYRHLAIHPYPSEVEKTVQLKQAGGGENAGRSPVLLRPMQPDDARLEVAFFDRLSAETRQWRFLHPIKALTPEMIARFTQVDYDRDMALVALPVGADGEPEDRIVGVTRYVREAEETRCEFAIVVDDQWQGRGLARAMLRHLIDHARTVGLRTMVGYVHLQNLRMLRFMRAMGFELSESAEEPSLKLATLQLQLQLQPPAPEQA